MKIYSRVEILENGSKLYKLEGPLFCCFCSIFYR